MKGALRRVFGDGENPLTWGLPIYTAFGIRVRLHVFFLIYIIAELVRSFSPNHAGLGITAAALGILFGLVLLHEYGHCLACRKVGGEADDILLWPLGGLASCLPPHTWRANLVTVIGGPAVNAVIFPFTALALGIATGGIDVLLVNPFMPSEILLRATLPGDGTQPWWLLGLAITHQANLTLLLFNVLLPMFPMDGGRILRDTLWRFKGYREATEIAVTVGFVAAGIMFVAALVFGQTMLMGLAIFAGAACYIERRQLRALDDVAPMGIGGEVWTPAGLDDDDAEPSRAERKAQKRAEKEEADRAARAAEVDRILEKISASGLDSLTKSERKTLEQASADGETP